jgi:hypothetical protein
MSEDNNNATEGMAFDHYQACANMARISHGIIAAITAVKAYQAQTMDLIHGLLDPDIMVEGLMNNAAGATSEALEATDALADQCKLGSFYSQLSPKHQCAVKGYSEELVRLFEKEKPTGED